MWRELEIVTVQVVRRRHRHDPQSTQEHCQQVHFMVQGYQRSRKSNEEETVALTTLLAGQGSGTTPQALVPVIIGELHQGPP